MAAQARRSVAMSSANASRVASFSKLGGMRRSSQKTSGLASARKDAMITYSAMASTLRNVTEFENANLIHQKRLKVNNSQISKATLDFSELMAQYMTASTHPPTTTSAFRKHVSARLRTICKHHSDLLNVRKDMLEKQQVWLEGSMKVGGIQDSDRMMVTIDMQIEAARDLEERQKQGALMQELTQF